MNHEVRKKLEESNWKEIVPELTRYALFKIEGLHIVLGSAIEPTDIDLIVRDVVMDSIEKVFNGTRVWDPHEKPDILIHLKSIVKSTVSRLYKDKESQTTRRFRLIHNEEKGSISDEEFITVADNNKSHNAHINVNLPATPEALMIGKQQEAREDEFINKLTQELDGDGEAEDMLLCIMEGYSRRRDIAEQMGIDVSKVTNIKKRLQRKFTDSLQSYIKKEKVGYESK